MKIIYMGTSEFAVPALLALLDSDTYEVVAVVTQPDRPKGRGNKLAFSPVKELAVQYPVPILQPERIRRKAAMAELASFDAALFVVASYGQILPEAILNMPRYGCINIHASLLPKYRGSSPIQQAVLHGDAESGVTIIQMDKGIDTGDMLLKRSIPIEPGETSGGLHDKLAALGALALLDVLPSLESGMLQPVAQDETASSHAPMLTKEMGLIDWSHGAREIVCLVHGMNPWPYAYTIFDNKPLKLLQAEICAWEKKAAPGTVLEASPKTGLIIMTGNGALRVGEMQTQNGKRMRPEDYLRGHEIRVGTILGRQSDGV